MPPKQKAGVAMFSNVNENQNIKEGDVNVPAVWAEFHVALATVSMLLELNKHEHSACQGGHSVCFCKNMDLCCFKGALK